MPFKSKQCQSNASSYSKKKATVSNKGNKRRRILSSETIESSHSSDLSDSEAKGKNMEMDEVPEVLSDFMDKFDCNFEAIMQRLSESPQWRVMEESMCSMEQDMDILKKENQVLRRRLLNAEGCLIRTEKKLKDAKEKILDLTVRSMRDNLVIKNVQESRGENLELKLKDILARKLKISEPEVKEMVVERIHRIGKPSRGSTPRKIVVKLSSKSKSKVMSNLKHLSKDDDIKINEQFPPEIHARRNKLWPQFTEAKRTGKEAKFNSDKLIIDNKTVNPPQDEVRDINLDIIGRSMELKPKHTPLVSVDRSHYQGHIVPVTCADDILPAIHALYQNHQVAGSTTLSYAYRIGNENRCESNFDDDEQWGAGRAIMQALDRTGNFNHLVAVSRWSSGGFQGQPKAGQIREVAEQAVKLVQNSSDD